MEPSMMLEPVVSLIGDYKSTVFEDGPYPDRGDPKEHNHLSFSGARLSAWGIRGVIITLWNVSLTPRTSCFSLSILFIVFSHISILGYFRSIPWKVIDPPVLTCITSCWSGCHDEAVHQNVHCCRQAHTKKYYRVYEFCGGYHCAFK